MASHPEHSIMSQTDREWISHIEAMVAAIQAGVDNLDKRLLRQLRTEYYETFTTEWGNLTSKTYYPYFQQACTIEGFILDTVQVTTQTATVTLNGETSLHVPFGSGAQRVSPIKVLANGDTPFTIAVPQSASGIVTLVVWGTQIPTSTGISLER